MHITKGEIYLKKICSLNLKYSRVCVCVWDRENEKERERERESAARNCNTHKQIATQKAAGLPSPFPPPLLPPLRPSLCMCALDALGAIHLLLLPFLPVSPLFFFLILWGLLRDGNPGSKMRWWISSLPFRQCGTRLWNAWSWRQCSAICNKNVYK